MITVRCTGIVFHTTFVWVISELLFLAHNLGQWLTPVVRWEKVDPSKPASSWMKPLVRGKVTDLVEVPMNWFQDGKTIFTNLRLRRCDIECLRPNQISSL